MKKGHRKGKTVCTGPECTAFAVCKGMCNRCYRAERRKDPDIKARQQAYAHNYQTDPNRKLHWRLDKYGISSEDYLKMLASQADRCKVCKRTPAEAGMRRDLMIDHCHKSGKVRGLLCSKCNVALGGFRDSIKAIRSAISYVCRFSDEKS